MVLGILLLVIAGLQVTGMLMTIASKQSGAAAIGAFMAYTFTITVTTLAALALI
jgi:hypothetical protein